MRMVRHRYKIVLGAPASTYTKMFENYSKLSSDNPQKEAIDSYIEWARKTLKRDDRIVWYLRQVRPQYSAKHKNDKAPRLDYSTTKKLEHYMGLITQQKYHLLDRVPFKADESFADLDRKLSAVEKQEAEAKRKKNAALEKAPTFLKVANGWEWQFLDRKTCKKEGDAMEHCGNAAAKAGDRILSLREPVKNGWIPHLTFIWNKDGAIGESKGRANSKPSSKYHPYILPLLEDKRITGLRGGGHKPENNFKIADLDEGQREELKKKRPDIVVDQIPEAKLEEIAEMIRHEDEGMARYYTEDYEAHFERDQLEERYLEKSTQKVLEEYKEALKLAGKKYNVKDVLDQATDIKYHSNEYKSFDNTLAFDSVNDQEVDLSDDVVEAIEELSDEDKERLNEMLRMEDFLLHLERNTITLSCSGGWFLVLEEEKLQDMVVDVLNDLDDDVVIPDELNERYPLVEVQKDLPAVRVPEDRQSA